MRPSNEATLRLRGPIPGTTTGRKRKADNELSDNTHTIRGRQRKQALEAKGVLHAQLDREKRNDNQAINRANKKLVNSTEYQQTTRADQQAMKKKLEDNVLRERYNPYSINESIY
jgi:hypothetical protein